MRIDGINPNTATTGSSKTRASGAGSREGTSAPAGDSVALGAAAALTGGESPVDAGRVQEIRRAIAEGRFQINPEAIAERLIESARELIDSQRRA